MTLRIFIEVESAPGTVTGAGPITDITRLSITNRLNQAGSWSMSLPATESQASLLTDQRTVMAYVMLNGVKTFLGGGAIDRKRTRVDDTGRLTLEVSGIDLLGEWSRTAIDNLTLDDTGQNNITNILINYAPAGWSYSLAETSKAFERQFINETPLAALVAIAKQMGHTFQRRTQLGVVRNLHYQVAPPAYFSLTCVMNLNALEAEGNANLATIVSIEEVRTSYDIINTVYVYGSGTGENRLDLAAATLWPNDSTAIGTDYTAASGDEYSYSSTDNSIGNATSMSTYGLRSKALQFSDVRPLENTNVGLTAAANTLVKAAVAYMEQHRAPQITYRFKLADLRTRIYPGDRIHIDARRWIDGVKPVDIDADVYVLSVTDVLDANGAWTADIEASNVLAWPEDTVTQLAQEAQLAKTVTSHPQMTGNIDTISHQALLVGGGQSRIWVFLAEETALLNKIVLRYITARAETPIANDGATLDVMITGDAAAMDHDHSSAGHMQEVTLGHSGNTNSATSPEPDTGHSHGLGASATSHVHYHGLDDHAAHAHGITWGYTAQDFALTYSVADIEFNINGETSGGLVWRSGAHFVGTTWGEWYSLDFTAQVSNATTKRPTATYFYIDVRAKTASLDPDFSCLFTAQVQARTVIQQIATF